GAPGRFFGRPRLDAGAASTPAGGHGATSVERVCMVTPLQSGGIALSLRGEQFSASPSRVLYAGGRKRSVQICVKSCVKTGSLAGEGRWPSSDARANVRRAGR